MEKLKPIIRSKFSKKLGKLAGYALSLLLAVAMFMSQSIYAIKQGLDHIVFAEPDLQNEGVVRPEDLDEGLSLKSLKDIEGRRVTIRQPYMEVTSRTVDRTEPGLLSDVFQFIDPETKKPYVGEGADKAKIDFAAEGELGDKTNPRYPMMGLENNSNQKYFSNFVKYMLLRQAWYYRTQAVEDMENNSLKKHPAADGIYGAIPKDTKAVTKIIVSDPIYRSPLTTGLYLAPGEVATVTVSGLKPGESIRLTTHQQDSLGYDGGYETNNDQSYNGLSNTEKYFKYWDTKLINEAKRAYTEGDEPDYTQFSFSLQNQWQFQNQKVPCMGSIFDITGNGEHKIGSIYGGPLYLQPTSSEVKITISGAIETPHFILGVTTRDEFENYLRKSDGLIATLDVENGQLIGLAKYMKNCDDIVKLAYFWHSVFAINSSLNGRAYNYNVTMAYDVHVPAGEAVALNSSFAAQPYGWFEKCMSYETLTTAGNWGTFHELGHIQAKTHGVNWGMCSSNCKNPCEGEVWNNTLIVLMYSMLCNMDNRFIKVEHGEYVHPYTSVVRSMQLQPVEDYHDYNKTSGAHFDQLSLYSTLIHSFGPERFVDFFYTYEVNPSYCDEARADFIYRIALVDHVNIYDWINSNYHGNVERRHFTDDQWNFLQTLPVFYPIAYQWANGIDGNETARKYEVDGKYDTIFDLSDSCFASYRSFEILKVTDPTYGTINYDKKNQRATYTPPTAVTAEDGFDIVVQTEGGRIVTLNVRFKLLYRGTYAEVWKLETTAKKQLVEDAWAEIEGKLPVRTEESSSAGKNNFNAASDQREYYHFRFKFVATTAGTHQFYMHGDDAALVTFYENDKDGRKLGELRITHDNPSYGTNNVETYLNEGDTVYVDAHLVNWGGPGNLYVGVKFPDAASIVNIPSTNIVNAEATQADLETSDNFEDWQPRFLDSIKDASVDYLTHKTGWTIVSAPETQVGDGQGKDAMVDGNDTTYYHSRYQGYKPALPHEIILDCGQEQSANYFEVYRRGTGNDVILEMAVYGARDQGGELPTEDQYQLLFSGLTSELVKNPASTSRYRVTFKDSDFRYYKLVILQNSGQTVIRELLTGRMVELKQTVKPNNYEKEKQGFEENSANGKLTATSQSAFYEFEFLGSGFDIFADTDPEYGTARVEIDGQYAGDIDLCDELIFNKCVFRSSGLEVRKHTVKIITTSPKKFNISFINVTYGVPVGENDYPAVEDDYGDQSPLVFSTDWKTAVSSYKDLTSITFTNEVPDGYDDTYIRISKYIRVYSSLEDQNKIAFVYKGTILAPEQCSALFAGCTNLKEVKFDNFDTSRMMMSNSMFNGCAKVESLKLATFDTTQTMYLSSMFENCTSLEELDLSAFTINSGAMLTNLINGCTSLQKLYVPKVFKGNFQLPKRFIDLANKRLYTSVSSANAGHILLLHEEHTYKHINGVSAGCTTTGTLAHDLCTMCGSLSINGREVKEKDLVIPAKGHDWGEWTVTKEPTLSSEGQRQRECSLGHIEIETIPAKGVSIALIVGLSCGGVALVGVTIFLALKLKKKKTKSK